MAGRGEACSTGCVPLTRAHVLGVTLQLQHEGGLGLRGANKRGWGNASSTSEVGRVACGGIGLLSRSAVAIVVCVVLRCAVRHGER